ncbi:MAG: hypothetical protein ABUL57_03030, partial [Chloroflexota bacterium]
MIATFTRSGGGRNGRRAAILVAAAIVLATVAAVLIALPRGGQAGAAGPAPRFRDVTAISGVDHTYGGPFLYAVGGGVAVLDCDADGR